MDRINTEAEIGAILTKSASQKPSQPRVSKRSPSKCCVVGILTASAHTIRHNRVGAELCPGARCETPDDAARVGSLELVRHFRSRGNHCTVQGADSAVENGHCDVVADLEAHGIMASRTVLMALYESTNGNGWKKSSHWGSHRPLCSWHGVLCSAEGNVIALNLSANDLEGTIPDSIGKLVWLEDVNFLFNKLSGRIPDTISDLTRLRSLDLYNNHLTGEIPISLSRLTRLETLALGRNKLQGSIATVVQVGCCMSRLLLLQVPKNKLTGVIPDSIRCLTNLSSLQLSDNLIEGRIPPGIGALTNLCDLDLSMNKLSGPIPESMSSLSRLEDLSLWGNELSGKIPQWISQLTDLKKLELTSNNLTGPIPNGIGSITSLIEFGFDENPLTGRVPADLLLHWPFELDNTYVEVPEFEES